MNNSTQLNNSFLNSTTTANSTQDTLQNTLYYTRPYLTAFILSLYCIIFIIGMIGNSLVLLVVAKFKSMQTVTNIFIACLSISDILICLFSIPFTPANALMPSWILGDVLCRLVPMIQATSVFVSTMASVVIAVDRFIVICYPHTPRMTSLHQRIVIAAIWIIAASAALPICIFQKLKEEKKRKTCTEDWPNNYAAEIYTWVMFTLQLALPSVIITICYSAISYQLWRRTKSRHGTRDNRSEKAEIQRNRRVNRMLIAMIVIFIICWLPLNLFLHMVNSINPDHIVIVFFFVHLIAISSVMYNPFLYGWLNENFNQHFRDLWKKIPCVIKWRGYRENTAQNCTDRVEGSSLLHEQQQNGGFHNNLEKSQEKQW